VLIGYYSYMLGEELAKWMLQRGIRGTIQPLYETRTEDGEQHTYAALLIGFEQVEDEVRYGAALRALAAVERFPETDGPEWGMWHNDNEEWTIRIGESLSSDDWEFST
jgi:hypothetical protein